MNYVYDVKKRNVKITSRNGYLKVQIVYHIKKLIFGNLSVWVDFDELIFKISKVKKAISPKSKNQGN
jgi:hypothetical protein